MTKKNDRIRKAWRVTIRGYDDSDVFFAPTRQAARKAAYQCVDSATWLDVSAVRCPEADVELPARHKLADELSAKEKDALLHSFGVTCGDVTKAGYRDYFYTSRDDEVLCALTDRGLMKPSDGDRFGENMTYFIGTDLGREVAMSMCPRYDGEVAA